MITKTCNLPGLTSDLWLVVDEMQTLNLGLRRAHRWEVSAGETAHHRRDPRPVEPFEKVCDASSSGLFLHCQP